MKLLIKPWSCFKLTIPDQKDFVLRGSPAATGTLRKGSGDQIVSPLTLQEERIKTSFKAKVSLPSMFVSTFSMQRAREDDSPFQPACQWSKNRRNLGYMAGDDSLSHEETLKLSALDMTAHRTGEQTTDCLLRSGFIRPLGLKRRWVLVEGTREINFDQRTNARGLPTLGHRFPRVSATGYSLDVSGSTLAKCRCPQPVTLAFPAVPLE